MKYPFTSLQLVLWNTERVLGVCWATFYTPYVNPSSIIRQQRLMPLHDQAQHEAGDIILLNISLNHLLFACLPLYKGNCWCFNAACYHIRLQNWLCLLSYCCTVTSQSINAAPSISRDQRALLPHTPCTHCNQSVVCYLHVKLGRLRHTHKITCPDNCRRK